jgi:hypothetical protein
VRQLDRLLSRVDERISQIIEHGATKHLYFLRVPLPQVDGSVVGLVKATRQRYIPMESPAVTRLITIARAELRPNKMEPRPPSGAAQSRDDFEAAILHRPGGRTSPDAIGA